jgi:hypothetical protein
MSRQRRDSAPAGWQLAAWLGPERVALVLTIVVVIALAVAFGIGPFAAGPAPSPSMTSAPLSSVTDAAPGHHPAPDRQPPGDVGV